MKSNRYSVDGNFFKSTISESSREEMLAKNIWSRDCPVPFERLILLNISYIDYNGNKNHHGQMVVFDVVADRVLNIFRTLYIQKFPIHSIKLINDFSGDDDLSLQANNTSSFNCRKIMNSNRFSIHSYGMAIDINPLQNPCLDTEYKEGKKSVDVLPPQGMHYINRTKIRPGMVESVIDDASGLTVVELFAQNGFHVWGGQWNFPIDLHHFQLSAADSQQLASLSFDRGIQYFASILKKYTV